MLLARFSAIGDVAMTVPVIYSACRTHPDVHFVMVTRLAMAGIFLGAPTNLRVVGVDLKEQYHGMSGMRRLVADMVKEYDIDCFIDLHDVIRTRLMGLFCRLRGIKVARINKGRSEKRALTRRSNKVMLPLTPQIDRYRQAFEKAGLGVTDNFNGLFSGQGNANAELFEKITTAKPTGVRWIGIAPFAAHPGKIYPPKQMFEVVKLLSAHEDVRIFLLGGGGSEQQELERWESQLPRVQSLAGKRYGFAMEIALFNYLDVMLAMDSANMHLASIAGAPTISIWGATHPYCGFKGWHQSEDDTVQLTMDCRPCSVFGDKPCHRGDMLCLTAIKPEVVYNKVMQKL